jgi:hypothetical protein
VPACFVLYAFELYDLSNLSENEIVCSGVLLLSAELPLERRQRSTKGIQPIVSAGIRIG